MFAVAVPNNLRAVLDEQGITPYKLAKLWGKHPNHVYKLVNEETLDNKTVKTIVEIAKILNVSVDRLVQD